MFTLIDQDPLENAHFYSSLPTTLDAPDVYGLFQSFSGVRYFVIHREDGRTFVALNHPSHRPFSVMEPSKSEPEYGCWWGHVWLYLAARASKTQRRDPGVLRVKGGKVFLRCHTGTDTAWIPFARHSDKVAAHHYSDWSLEITKPHYPCVDFSHKSGLSWVTEHHSISPIDDESIPLMMKF